MTTLASRALIALRSRNLKPRPRVLSRRTFDELFDLLEWAFRRPSGDAPAWVIDAQQRGEIRTVDEARAERVGRAS